MLYDLEIIVDENGALSEVRTLHDGTEQKKVKFYKGKSYIESEDLPDDCVELNNLLKGVQLINGEAEMPIKSIRFMTPYNNEALYEGNNLDSGFKLLKILSNNVHTEHLQDKINSVTREVYDSSIDVESNEKCDSNININDAVNKIERGFNQTSKIKAAVSKKLDSDLYKN